MDETLNEIDHDAMTAVKDMSARRRLEELMDERRAAAELQDFEDYEI